MISLDWTLLYQMGLFLALMVFLSKVLFKPILAVLDARERAHLEPTKRAEDLLNRARAEADEYAKIMSEAKSQSDRVRDEIVKDAHEQEHTILEAAMTNAGDMTATARKDLAAARETVKKEVDAQAARLAGRLVSRLIGH